MNVMNRAGEVAREILNRRDPLRRKLGDETFVTILLAEAYAVGLRAGLSDALAAVEAELETAKSLVEYRSTEQQRVYTTGVADGLTHGQQRLKQAVARVETDLA